MKLFLPAFLFFTCTAFAQNVKHLEADVTVVFSPKVYGYVMESVWIVLMLFMVSLTGMKARNCISIMDKKGRTKESLRSLIEMANHLFLFLLQIVSFLIFSTITVGDLIKFFLPAPIPPAHLS